jgi:hypothetical protein
MAGEGMLRSADKLLAPAVESTLAALDPADVDAAVVKLTRRYAAAIDDADDLATEAEAVARALDPDDIDGRQQLAVLALKVEGQAVLGAFGPKLLAALKELHATPAARARRKSGGGGDRPEPTRLQALRETRRA